MSLTNEQIKLERQSHQTYLDWLNDNSIQVECAWKSRADAWRKFEDPSRDWGFTEWYFRRRSRWADLREQHEQSKRDGKPFTVQQQGILSRDWFDDKDPRWREDRNYRRKPEPRRVPLTWEDRELVRGKWVKLKKADPGIRLRSLEGIVDGFEEDDTGRLQVTVRGKAWDWGIFVRDFTLDGKPLEKEVAE